MYVRTHTDTHIKFIFVYVYVCAYMHKCTACMQVLPQEATGPARCLGTGVTGNRDSPDVGAEEWTWVWIALDHSSTSPCTSTFNLGSTPASVATVSQDADTPVSITKGQHRRQHSQVTLMLMLQH